MDLSWPRDRIRYKGMHCMQGVYGVQVVGEPWMGDGPRGEVSLDSHLFRCCKCPSLIPDDKLVQTHGARGAFLGTRGNSKSPWWDLERSFENLGSWVHALYLRLETDDGDGDGQVPHAQAKEWLGEIEASLVLVLKGVAGKSGQERHVFSGLSMAFCRSVASRNLAYGDGRVVQCTV